MLHANVLLLLTYVYFSGSAMVSLAAGHCFVTVRALFRIAIVCHFLAALLPNDSAHVSFGQFLWPVPLLARQHNVSAALCVTVNVGHHVVSMFKFDHCVSTLVLALHAKSMHSTQKTEVQCLVGTLFT